jgi:23S rRNA (cytidine1920-2'-O)/16S rRNA (cytidine1409-2'-O)-methyltransferase
VSKQRLDTLLVERGLVASRERARALILAGQVLVRGRPGGKAGEMVTDDADVSLVVPDHPYVGRGGLKLAHAIATFQIPVTGRTALDIGASTGGFTDVLLQNGAAHVVALDVGHGQLHPRIRDDDRVTVLERVNARELSQLPFAPDLVTCDVSFISVRVALPPALRLAASGWEALVLVKPQFEAGREEATRGGGVIRDREVHARVLREVAEAALEWDAETVGVVDSGLPGPKGNREFFLHLRHREHPTLSDELERWIDDATR